MPSPSCLETQAIPHINPTGGAASDAPDARSAFVATLTPDQRAALVRWLTPPPDG